MIVPINTPSMQTKNNSKTPLKYSSISIQRMSVPSIIGRIWTRDTQLSRWILLICFAKSVFESCKRARWFWGVILVTLATNWPLFRIGQGSSITTNRTHSTSCRSSEEHALYIRKVKEVWYGNDVEEPGNAWDDSCCKEEFLEIGRWVLVQKEMMIREEITCEKYLN